MKACVAVLLALSFALAGCGGDDEAEEPTEESLETVDVSLVDFRLEPDSVHVDQAGTYTFRVTNDGQTQHALEIEGSDLEEETETLDPGESDTITVELARGRLRAVLPGRRAQGPGHGGRARRRAVSRGTVRDRQARSARALAKDGDSVPSFVAR